MDVATAAAQAGGEVILKAHRGRTPGKPAEASAKGHNDYVTDVDKQAERQIISIITELYPDHEIQAEESPARESGSPWRWIIDPLDGTTNFIHGYPMFAVSIGLAHENRMHLGVVFDPLRNEMFRAEVGEGAWLNDRRIGVSAVRDLRASLLLTGFPFKAQEHLEKYLHIFKDLFRASSGVRRAGSASLDLAYVACGRADGFFEMALSPWDMAAGAVLVLEAGGAVADFAGGEDYIATGNILAGHADVIAQMLPWVRRHF
jgi:myo-inositol-1(or 4)-monophosphatase